MTDHDKQPDLIGDAFNTYVLHYCHPTIHWAWDQWAICRITCEHGTYKGTAAGLNLLAAFLKGADKINAAHPQCHRDVLWTSSWGTEIDPCEMLAGHDGACTGI